MHGCDQWPRFRRRRVSAALAGVVLSTITSSCGGGGDGESTEPITGGGIRAIAGANVTDTVLAQPLQALVVEVRGPDGALARGTVVRFEPAPPADTLRRDERAVYACSLAASSCGPSGDGFGTQFGLFAADTTDANGRAQALVRLGTVAGPVGIVVSAPEYGLRDTVRFTVRAGAASRVAFGVRDAAVYPGATVALRPAVRDRFNNPRGDAFVVAGEAPAVATVDAAGVATGRDFGRARVLVRAGDLFDTTFVSVVPRGRLVAWEPSFFGNGTYGALLTVGLDGSALRRLATNVESELGAFPAWSSDGSRVSYHSKAPRAFVIDTAGASARDVSGSTVVAHQIRFAPDGSVRFLGTSEGRSGVWRADADGSTARELVRLGDYFPAYGAADVSEDAQQVVYVNTSGALRVADLATGAIRALGVNGSAPRWSPTGDRIAYLTGSFLGAQLATVRADGTQQRVVPQDASEIFSAGIAWSPDAQWLLARSARVAQLRLVRVPDGMIIPLRLQGDFFQPSWR